MEPYDILTGKPTLDETVLNQLIVDLGEDQDQEGSTLALLIGDYRAECKKHIEDLRLACAEKNPPLLRRAAHTLKSSSAMFGAVKLSGMAKILEEMGRSGSTENAPELLFQVEIELEKVLGLLPFP